MEDLRNSQLISEELSVPTRNKQTKLESLIEIVFNTAIGFVVSAAAWPFVATAFGYPYSISHNLAITAIFTGLSVARGYIVRRFFEHGLHTAAHEIARRWYATNR